MRDLIAIDQGTTSTRAVVFDAALSPLTSASEELRQIDPTPGEVEHEETVSGVNLQRMPERERSPHSA